jgi:signal transduction histidine kinase
MSKTLTLSVDPGAITSASLLRRSRIQTAILDTMTDAIVVSDIIGTTYQNPAATRLFGSQFLDGWQVLLSDGRTPCPPEQQPLGRATRGEVFEEEFCCIHPDGHTIWVSASGRALIDNGTAVGGLVVFRDTTERRELERRLFLADRMASLGMLAAGVGHEINSPLTYMMLNLEHAIGKLERKQADPEALLGAVRKSLDGAERVKKIVANLRTYSSGNAAPTNVDVAHIVEVAVGIASASIQQRALLICQVGAVPPVVANEARLSQVLVNLLVNAGQAIVGPPEDNQIYLIASLQPDGRVCLEVRDTGTGIPPANLPHIFDPFFTTKATGEGTGLGLWITHGIVSEMKGEITVSSQVGGGSTFRVYLPAGTAPASKA